jgi:hypothetical protein
VIAVSKVSMITRRQDRAMQHAMNASRRGAGRAGGVRRNPDDIDRATASASAPTVTAHEFQCPRHPGLQGMVVRSKASTSMAASTPTPAKRFRRIEQPAMLGCSLIAQCRTQATAAK